MPNETAAESPRHASPTTPAPAARRHDVLREMRSSDVEPYTGLRYLSKLFRLMAILLVLVLLEELITGFYRFGLAVLPTLLGEVTRLIVAAGLLWGVGDFAILLIDVGHDVRATRILLARQVAHHVGEHHAVLVPADAAPDRAADAAR